MQDQQPTIKVGVIADQTGPLSFMGVAEANVATLVVDEINVGGGLLGRQVELHIEDSETDDSAAAAAATKLVQEDHVDVLLGGIFSSTRQAIKDPAVVEGETLYIYPEQYEGQEYHPLLFCTGAVPAQQVEPLIPWLMRADGSEDVLAAVGGLHLAARDERRRSTRSSSANGGEIVGEEYFPLDHADWGETVEQIISSGADVVFNTIVPPGASRSSRRCTSPASPSGAGVSSPRTSTRTPRPRCRPSTSRGCTGASTTTRTPTTRSARSCSTATTRCFPDGPHVHRRQRVHGHVPRASSSGRPRSGGRLARPGRRRRGARPREDRRGPGGPAEMVPGQHHVRMNMYIAQVRDGALKSSRAWGSSIRTSSSWRSATSRRRESLEIRARSSRQGWAGHALLSVMQAGKRSQHAMATSTCSWIRLARPGIPPYAATPTSSISTEIPYASHRSRTSSG